jgi:hypothetical protein
MQYTHNPPPCRFTKAFIVSSLAHPSSTTLCHWTPTVLGVDKNLYVEPAIWTVEWAQHYYKYPISRSN